MGQYYSEEQKKFLKEIIPGRTSEKVAELFNNRFDKQITMKKVQYFKRNYRISSGVVTRWGNGQKNRYMPEKGTYFPGSEKGWFKKGHKPFNKLPIGTVLQRADGYIYEKIAETYPSRKGWKQVHIMLWEKHNGPIPKSHCLIFKNQDRTDIRLENLMLITKAENVRMNKLGLFSMDPEVTEVGVTIAKVANKIGQVSKGIKEVKRNERRDQKKKQSENIRRI